MFELLVVIGFLWLMIKVVGLTFKVTWGLAKIVASILIYSFDSLFINIYL